MSNEELEEEIRKISTACLISCEKSADEKVWNFSLKGRKIWNVSLNFSYDFPNRLPVAKLLDKDDVGTLAHVNRECTICVEESDSIVINTSNPSKLVEYFLEKIVETLDHASLRINQVELTDEYEGYFQHDAVGDVNSFYVATDQFEIITLSVIPIRSGHLYRQNHHYHFPVLLLDQRNEYPAHFSNIKKAISTIINIIHLPLDTPVLPPSNAEKLTANYIYYIFDNISLENKSALNSFLEKTKPKKEFFILLSMPRQAYERTQLLLQYIHKDDKPHPFIEYSDQWELRFYTVQRNHREYLLERGGAKNILSNKKVAIVGCGSVGGEIAFMLAKAGIEELTLIDNDDLKVDNIYRHRLGGSYLNYEPEKLKTSAPKVKPYSKVAALQFALQKDLPYVNVTAVKNFFEKILDKEYIVNADLIIIAVGSPTLNLKFNTELKRRDVKHAIFCWNEAAGYGGHSVRLNLDICCLNCLYTYEDGYSNICKLNLLDSGQNISKNLTGCAGVFTPFSYLDSSQTAILAANQSVQLLLNHDLTSKAASWKGKGTGSLKTTARYDTINLVDEFEISRAELCKVCNDK